MNKLGIRSKTGLYTITNTFALLKKKYCNKEPLLIMVTKTIQFISLNEPVKRLYTLEKAFKWLSICLPRLSGNFLFKGQKLKIATSTVNKYLPLQCIVPRWGGDQTTHKTAECSPTTNYKLLYQKCELFESWDMKRNYKNFCLLV